MNSIEKLQFIIDGPITNYLACHNYRRKRAIEYLQWEDDYLSLIRFSNSKVRNSNAVAMGAGVSVGYRSLVEFWMGSESIPRNKLDNPIEPRIYGGELMLLTPEGIVGDRIVDENVTIDEAADEIIYEIDQYAMPFFHNCRDVDYMIEGWIGMKMASSNPRATAYAAAALWMRGKKVRAIDLLDKYIENEKKRPKVINVGGLFQITHSEEQMKKWMDQAILLKKEFLERINGRVGGMWGKQSMSSGKKF